MNVQHQVGDTKGVARSLYQIAASFMEEDNVAEAAEGFRHAIKVMRGVEDHAGISLALQNLSVMAERTGNPQASFQFIAAAAARCRPERSSWKPPQPWPRPATRRSKRVSTPKASRRRWKRPAEGFAGDDGETLIAEAFGQS